MAIGAAHVGVLGTAESEGASRELAAIGRASEWLNSSRLTRESLAGKVVLVQFWTYTCAIRFGSHVARQLPVIRHAVILSVGLKVSRRNPALFQSSPDSGLW